MPVSLTPFVDNLPIPHMQELLTNTITQISMVRTNGFLHRDLEIANLHTIIWKYRGAFPLDPFPLLIVTTANRVFPLHIKWNNAIPTDGNPATVDFPFSAIVSPADTQFLTGTSPAPQHIGFKSIDLSKYAPFTVVHLHGAKTHPDSDGWTENGLLSNQCAYYTYNNKDNSTMFWFHDHAMGITRFNVYSGLAGVYLLRDTLEDRLNLPRRTHGFNIQFEIPLVIQDRNLETNNAGNLTGHLLHKVEGRTVNYTDTDGINKTQIVQDGTMEFFGPFNLVNGKIWPKLNVHRAVYRFRIVNGSNGRTYKFKLFDIRNKKFLNTKGLIMQIGGDGGLFPKPVTLSYAPMGGIPLDLILAPGERADILIDFRKLPRSANPINIILVNIASAPYDGTDINLSGSFNPLDVDSNDPNNHLLIRQTNSSVMKFIVDNIAMDNYNIVTYAPTMNAYLNANPSYYHRLAHNSPDLVNHNHRFIALVEEKQKLYKSDGITPILDDTAPNIENPLTEPMLMLRELEEISLAEYNDLAGVDFRLTAIDLSGMTPNVCYYKSVASMFYDPITFFIRYNTWEVWKIINLTGDTHPFHVHLVQFQSLGRRRIVEDIPNLEGTLNSVGAIDFNITLDPLVDNVHPENNLLDLNERGWKDTIRVNPREIMSIVMKFDGHCGKYMYHCHLLEHEDREMMRPFVVLPDAVIDNMKMGEHHH